MCTYIRVFWSLTAASRGRLAAGASLASLPRRMEGTALWFRCILPGLKSSLAAISFEMTKSSSVKCLEHTNFLGFLSALGVFSAARNCIQGVSCRFIRCIHDRRSPGSTGRLWNDPSYFGRVFVGVEQLVHPTTTQYTIFWRSCNWAVFYIHDCRQAVIFAIALNRRIGCLQAKPRSRGRKQPYAAEARLGFSPPPSYRYFGRLKNKFKNYAKW